MIFTANGLHHGLHNYKLNPMLSNMAANIPMICTTVNITFAAMLLEHSLQLVLPFSCLQP